MMILPVAVFRAGLFVALVMMKEALAMRLFVVVVTAMVTAAPAQEVVVVGRPWQESGQLEAMKMRRGCKAARGRGTRNIPVDF